MVTVAIHQPGYLPWFGFFKKMMNSDIFVFFDDVQFVKKEFQNRNRIRINSGEVWLTVPVMVHHESQLNKVKIDQTKNWVKKHKKSLMYNYSAAEYFNEFTDFIEKIYDDDFELLIDLNIDIISEIMKKLELKTKTIRSSELGITFSGSDKVLNICKSLNANRYISGTVWAKTYLKVEDFKKNEIVVEFQEYEHPVYRQLHGKFIPNLSLIDMLFNEGTKKSKEILLKTVIKSQTK